MKNLQFDCCQRFLFHDSNVRGQIVRLGTELLGALEPRNYPEAIQALLGEALTAAALLADTVKLDGSLIMQIQGDGPISTLVAQASGNGELRGMAHRKSDDYSGDDFRNMLGDGRLVITIDAGKNEQYQGIVDLDGNSLNAAIETYFARSEQLPTRLWLASDGNQAGGVLLQQLPGQPLDQDLWNHLLVLTETITPEELIQLPPMELINRLYHQESVSVYEPTALSFRCSCTREKIERVLLQLGKEEIESLASESGDISVQCEFCNQNYIFDLVDATALFVATNSTPSVTQ